MSNDWQISYGVVGTCVHCRHTCDNLEKIVYEVDGKTMISLVCCHCRKEETEKECSKCSLRRPVQRYHIEGKCNICHGDCDYCKEEYSRWVCCVCRSSIRCKTCRKRPSHPPSVECSKCHSYCVTPSNNLCCLCSGSSTKCFHCFNRS